MNTEVWYLPYFEGVYHSQMIETFPNANAPMISMIHTLLYMYCLDLPSISLWIHYLWLCPHEFGLPNTPRICFTQSLCKSTLPRFLLASPLTK